MKWLHGEEDDSDYGEANLAGADKASFAEKIVYISVTAPPLDFGYAIRRKIARQEPDGVRNYAV